MKFHPSVLQSAKKLVYCLPIPGVVAAVTYLVTLSRDVYPGLSAALTAEAFGVIPPSEAAHPLFALLARGVASLDLFSLPVRLNLISACCGTLCAMLIYHLVSRLILLSACEDAGGGGRVELSGISDAVSGGASALPPEVEAYNRRIFPIALTGGLIAAFLFIFMAPIWSAATRLDKGLFDLLLALAALSLFPWDNTSYRLPRLVCSSLLFALGLFDSAIFLFLLPCYAFFLFKVFLSSNNRVAIMGRLLAVGLVASTLAIYAYAQNSEVAHGNALWPLLCSYAHALLVSHYRELLSFFPRSGWALVLAQTGLPALILLFGRKIIFKERQIHTWLVLLLVMGVAVPDLLNLSIAPFFIFQPIGYLPVFGSAILAANTAMVLMAFLFFLKVDEVPQEKPDARQHHEAVPSGTHLFLRGTVRLLLPILAVLVLATPFRSFHVTNMQSSFADETARAMLDQMKGRTWLISNGYLDNHLLIQATLRKQPLTLIPLMPKTQLKEAARLKRLIVASPDFNDQNRLRLQNALALGTVRFVREWFMTDSDVGRRAMVFATPDIWTSCGYIAVPEGLAFGGIRNGQKPSLTNLVEGNRVFTGRILPLLPKEGNGYVADLSAALRLKMGLVANELGVLLEEQGQAEVAYQAYVQASLIDPKNISAVVNGLELASAQKMESKAISRLSKKIKELTEGRNFQRNDITWILQNYGTIRQQAFYQQQAKMWSSLGARSIATDKMQKALAMSEQTGVNALIENASVYLQSGDFVKAEACYMSTLEKDPVNKAALTGMSLLTLNQNKIAETKKWVHKALAAGVEKDTLLYPSITIAIFEKDNVLALKLLEDATQKFPTDLRYWTLKAEILLGQGQLLMVEQSVLPQMQKGLKDPDHLLIHSVRGFLLKKKGPSFFMEARQSLLRALSINAAMPDLWSALFELDLALARQDFTEVDARKLLNIEPDHALANYLLGGLLLSRGKLRESEDFLRRSIEKTPTAAACNDLGENLRRQQKLTEAEVFVRQALAIQPALLPAIDTLACILFDAGKYDEAAQHEAKVIAAQPKRTIYQLTMLRIQIKQGDYEGVQKRLTALEELKAEIPADLKKEIEALKENQKKG